MANSLGKINEYLFELKTVFSDCNAFLSSIGFSDDGTNRTIKKKKNNITYQINVRIDIMEFFFQRYLVDDDTFNKYSVYKIFKIIVIIFSIVEFFDKDSLELAYRKEIIDIKQKLNGLLSKLSNEDLLTSELILLCENLLSSLEDVDLLSTIDFICEKEDVISYDNSNIKSILKLDYDIFVSYRSTLMYLISDDYDVDRFKEEIDMLLDFVKHLYLIFNDYLTDEEKTFIENQYLSDITDRDETKIYRSICDQFRDENANGELDQIVQRLICDPRELKL